MFQGKYRSAKELLNIPKGLPMVIGVGIFIISEKMELNIGSLHPSRRCVEQMAQ